MSFEEDTNNPSCLFAQAKPRFSKNQGNEVYGTRRKRARAEAGYLFLLSDVISTEKLFFRQRSSRGKERARPRASIKKRLSGAVRDFGKTKGAVISISP